MASYPHIRRNLGLQSHTFFRSEAHFVSTEKCEGARAHARSSLPRPQILRRGGGFSAMEAAVFRDEGVHAEGLGTRAEHLAARVAADLAAGFESLAARLASAEA